MSCNGMGAAAIPPAHRGGATGRSDAKAEDFMDGIIYLVGLVVVVMFILSLLGLR